MIKQKKNDPEFNQIKEICIDFFKIINSLSEDLFILAVLL